MRVAWFVSPDMLAVWMKRKTSDSNCRSLLNIPGCRHGNFLAQRTPLLWAVIIIIFSAETQPVSYSFSYQVLSNIHVGIWWLLYWIPPCRCVLVHDSTSLSEKILWFLRPLEHKASVTNETCNEGSITPSIHGFGQNPIQKGSITPYLFIQLTTNYSSNLKLSTITISH